MQAIDFSRFQHRFNIGKSLLINGTDKGNFLFHYKFFNRIFIHILTFLLYQTAMKETFVNDSIFITNRFLALKPLKITFNFATEFIIPINI